MLRLYLVRHAQTDCSVANVFCGQCDAGLTARGHAMSQALAKALGGVNFTAVYASPLLRAQQSAAPLAEQKNLPVIALPGMRELHYGRWEGCTKIQLEQKEGDAFGRWLANPAANAPPGGETGWDVAARAAAALVELQASQPQGNVLVVSHKATLRILLCRLLGIDLRYFRVRLAQPLGALNIVDLASTGPLLHCLADVSYLPEHLREPWAVSS